MDKVDEGRRYKWTTSATNLLVSIWSHDMVQNRLELSSRNQPIWESIARYMGRKGFNVSGVQCRTRVKNMLSSYHECVRKNDRSGIEPYFDLFNSVIKRKSGKKRRDVGGKSLMRNTSKTCVRNKEDEEEKWISSDVSFEGEEQCAAKDPHPYDMEFLDVQSRSVQTMDSSSSEIVMPRLENAIAKALEMQTKTVVEAFKISTEVIERVVTAEREKFESALIAEKESRQRLEERLDKLLTKLETYVVPQVTYVGPICETRQNEVL